MDHQKTQQRQVLDAWQSAGLNPEKALAAAQAFKALQQSGADVSEYDVLKLVKFGDSLTINTARKTIANLTAHKPQPQGFNPKPLYWLQCVGNDGKSSWVSSRKSYEATLKTAGNILRQQSAIEYVLILNGQCDRTFPKVEDILGDVQREPVPGSRVL